MTTILVTRSKTKWKNLIMKGRFDGSLYLA